MNYLNRAGWVIVLCYAIIAAVSYFLTRTENEWKELNLLLILKELNIGGWFMARVWLR